MRNFAARTYRWGVSGIFRNHWFHGLILLAMVALHLALVANASDDAYIHIRISDNLANYGVPYFNPSQAIMGSSSALWTLLLGFVFLFFPAHPLALAVMNGVFLAVGAALWGGLLREVIGTRFSGLMEAYFSLAYILLVLPASIQLMESPFVLTVLAVTLWLLYRGKRWSFIFAGMLVFARIEFVFMLAGCIVLAWRVRKWPLKQLAALTALGAAPFLAYDLYFFQTVIPHTVIAKSMVYQLPFFQAALGFITAILMNEPPRIGGLVVLFIFSFSGVILLGPWNRPSVRRASGPGGTDTWPRLFSLTLGLCGLGILLFYLAGRPLPFGWYMPLFLVPMLFAAFYFLFDRPVWLLVVLLLLLENGAQLSYKAGEAFIAGQPPYLLQFFPARVRKYISVGEELYRAYPNARLMTAEIGGLGYGFRGQIIDGVGLISPEALKYHPMKVPEQRSNAMFSTIPLGLIKETDPELIVAYDEFIEEFAASADVARYVRIEEPPFLLEDMQTQSSLSNAYWNRLNIFIRKDIYKN